ncbi:MAG: hypothetical protein KDK61_08860, partial [Simkania sp.]|nr:hypothetical protein [Simkania sp.]
LVALGFLLGHIYANKHVAGLTWWHLVVIIMTVYCCVWTFVNFTADAAEGISTSFFAEHSLARDYQSMVQAQQVPFDILSPTNNKFKNVPTATSKPRTDTADHDHH